MTDPRGYATAEETEKILNACDNIRDYLLIRVLSRSGIRVSECISIKKKDLLENNQILIKQLKKRKESYRCAFVDETTMALLKKYAKEKGLGPDDYIFFSGNNKKKHITRQMAFMIVRKVCRKAGIERIGSTKPHPHHFRHGLAMRLIKAGVDIRKVQMILGHSSYSTTASYLRYGGKELYDAYKKGWNDKKNEGG